jgi:hypothetical protein
MRTDPLRTIRLSSKEEQGTVRKDRVHDVHCRQQEGSE